MGHRKKKRNDEAIGKIHLITALLGLATQMIILLIEIIEWLNKT